MLRMRAIPLSLLIVSPRSSSVPIHKFIDEEESDLEFMAVPMTWTHAKKLASSELVTDQVEGIKDKLKFSVTWLNNRIHLHMSRGSDKLISCPLCLSMIKH